MIPIITTTEEARARVSELSTIIDNELAKLPRKRNLFTVIQARRERSGLQIRFNLSDIDQDDPK